MAELAVTLVIGKLFSSLTEEVKLSEDVHEEVSDIKNDLEAIKIFLKDADIKAEVGEEGVKEWVTQAREVAYQIEDAIDQYMIRAAQHRDRHGSVGFFHRIFSLVRKLPPHINRRLEMLDVRNTLEKVKAGSERFHFTYSGQEAFSSSASNIVSQDPRLSSYFIEEVELVGIKSPKDELISLLASGTSQREVISVVGMGGVGKTTIAKTICQDQFVKRHFARHAWITVPQSYNIKQLLISALQQFHEERHEVFPKSFAGMDDLLLMRKFRGYLQDSRYLVVFDDVWETGFWGDVENVLLDNNNGSRVLITTRNVDVANFCRRSSLVHVYQMGLLNEAQSWLLFCRNAFKFEFGGHCPDDLRELSHQIVRECRGLPLAIVSIAGVLATKEKTVVEWKKFLDSLIFKLADDFGDVLKILSLSYDDVRYNLKSCFLYLAMFPEDFFIKRRRLIQLWVAEGFVQEKQGLTLEEVGAEYLNELIHRNLVLVDTLSVKGIPLTCRLHDLIRMVSLSKSEELSLCHVSSNHSTFEGISRHLSISNEGSDNPESITKSKTRSVMVFNGIKLQKSTVDAIFSNCKLLITLDFEECPIDYIPKELGNLLHLRYLNLRDTLVSKLPKSMGNLLNLESLDLRFSFVEELPVEIDRFPKLRHLLGSNRLGDGLKIRGSIGHLEFLQTLSRIKIDGDEARFIDELGMLKQLKKLGIDGLKREHGRDLCISLEKMTKLQSLWVSPSNSEDETLEVQSIFSPPIHLQTLQLWGQLEKLPEWISKLHSLSKVRLCYSKVMDDPTELLQILPNLKYLLLFYAYNGETMHFETGRFPKLKMLDIEGLKELNTMKIDTGAMPVIEELRIAGCPQLKEVPSGIQYLSSLRELYFARMSNDFNKRLSPNGGEDSWIVKHVPTLQCDGPYSPNAEALNSSLGSNNQNTLNVIDITASSTDPHP